VDHNGTQPGSRICLLDVEPDVGRFLTPEERAEAARLTAPVLTLAKGRVDFDAQLRSAGAFGAVIVEGVLLHRLVFGVHPALRLLGPGDIVARYGDAGSGALCESVYRSTGELRLALLDDRILAAGQRFPRLFAGLHVRMGEQHHRLATQLVICQLPRVEERILGMLWLLAQTWGHVTPHGTTVPVALTHDALGECIGARRPTVSLALKELAERGAVLRRTDGWLLTEAMPHAPERPPARLRDGAVEVVGAGPGVWRDERPPASAGTRYDGLLAMVATLRESHTQTQRDVRRRLAVSQGLRDRNVALREALATARGRRRPAP
jgi:CRP/FNR family transcriptional regulator, cyclic AMP receptor protein